MSIIFGPQGELIIDDSDKPRIIVGPQGEVFFDDSDEPDDENEKSE